MTPVVAGYLVFGTYIVLMVLIGLWSGRQQKGADDLWTAGRRFGTVVMVLGLMSSVMHGGSILSGVAFASAFGGVAILPLISFAAGFLVILLFFARKLRDIGAFTLSDFMADRFNSVGLRAFTAVVIALSCTVYLVAQIRGMGIVLSGLLDLPFVYAMALGTLLFVFYVVVGGILAVMWTNIAQFLFMWLGLLVIVPYVWQTAGGWTQVLERAEAVAPGWTSVVGTQWTWAYLLSWWLVWFIAYSTRIELITKVFIARDSNVARYALPTTCLLVMVFLLFGNLYLGAAARVLVFDGLSTPDAAFPALVTLVLGPVGTAVVLTSIASAANESLLLLAGAAVAHDLVRKSWHERAGIVRSEAYYLFISRVTLVIVGVVSFVAAINTPALILAIVSYSVAMIGATFFFPLLFGLSSPRTTPAAATASSVGGFLVTVVWTALTLAKVPWAASIHPIVPGLVTALVLIMAVTPFTQPAPPEALARFFARRTVPPVSPLQPLPKSDVDGAATAHRISPDPGRF
jgi:SSS family solute:Na+ symporter